MTERVVPGATRSPRLPGAWIWALGAEEFEADRGRAAGGVAELQHGRPAERGVRADKPQVVGGLLAGCRRGAAEVTVLGRVAHDGPCGGLAVGLGIGAQDTHVVDALLGHDTGQRRGSGGPGRGRGGLPDAGAALASSTRVPPASEASLLPGRTPAPEPSTTALTSLLAVADSGLNCGSVPTGAPSSSRAGPGQTPTLLPAGTAASGAASGRLLPGPWGVSAVADTSPPPAATRTTAERTPPSRRARGRLQPAPPRGSAAVAGAPRRRRGPRACR